MVVRLYEWDKTETGWAWIEITDNKVVNLKLRDENNLIKINEDDEAYVDLQLDDGIAPDDDLPVGVETWRVLVADGRPVNGTLILAKTTSWDEIQLLYWDDWKIYADNGTWTFKTLGWTTAYFKTQNEYDALPQSKESDNNLYIIVDSHIDLLTPPELYALGVAAGNSDDAIIAELNTHPAEYMEFAISNGWGQKSDFPWVPAWKTLYTWEVWILDDPNGWGVYATLITDMEENEFITFMLNNVPWATQEVVEQLWEKRSTYTMKRSAFPN